MYICIYACLSLHFFEKKRDSELYELDSELCGLRNGKPHLCQKKDLNDEYRDPNYHLRHSAMMLYLT